MTNSRFTGNETVTSGGAIAAIGLTSVELTGDTFDDNTQTADDPSAMSQGGAVSVVGPVGTSLHVAYSHFTGNVAAAPYGGAMQAEAHSVLIEHSDFTDNITQDGQGIGGAVKTNPGQEITFDDCTFTGNHGSTGGAIANEGEGTGHMLIENSRFVRNVSTGFGAVGGYRPYGSVLTVENSTFTENVGGALNAASTTIVRGSTFAGNTNDRAGGAIAAGPWAGPGDMFALTVTDSTFTGNTSTGNGWFGQGGGGAISAGAGPDRSGTATLERNLFEGNSVAFNGGAVQLNGNAVGATVTDCRFDSNRTTDGGTMWGSGGSGGAIHANIGETLTVTGSFFEHNRTGNGGIIGENGYSGGDGGAISFFGTGDEEGPVGARALVLGHDTFVSNTTGSGAVGTSSRGWGGMGGAVRMQGMLLSIANSTFDSNSTGADGNGGAIFTESTTSITGSTFTNNSSSTVGGVYFQVPGLPRR